MAQARRRRNQRTDDDDFAMPLADALAQLLPARHISPNDRWHFQVMGDEFVITRSRPTVTIPDPDS